MKTLKTLIILTCLTINIAKAQQEFSKWFLNNNTGLNFSTNPPTPISGFSLGVAEGVASIADAQGNLLFYSNGIAINNAAHNLMANGSGIIGNTSTTQGALIVKQPMSSSIYYVFTLDAGTAGNQGAHYSVVDMSLAAGMGSVVAKNNFLYSPSIEKQVAIRHCNGKDVWIVSHEGFSNNFYAYLLTASGLNPTPVISSTGDVYPGIGFWSAGEMKASPDGKKIGWATYSGGGTSFVAPCGFHLFDFDASSGTVSNALTLLNTYLAYGVEFSPDGTKMYGTQRSLPAVPNSTLCQWDVCSTNTTAIISSLYSTTVNARFSAIQRAIDNKLYLVNLATFSLCVVNSPNSSGAAMNLSVNSLVVGNSGCSEGLPNYVTGYTKPLSPQISTTKNCQQVAFSSPSYTSAAGCSSLPFPINGYLWDFGDPSSGALNTATTAGTSHLYSSLGTYTVSLIVYSNCENDTIKKVITISELSPSINVAGTFTVCKGDKRVYTASGGTSYAWSNSANAASVTLSPITTTTYNVVGTSSTGCTANKLFTITVNPCLSIGSANGSEIGAQIFPNPFNTAMSVEVSQVTQVQLYDLQGKVILDTNIESGIQTINTSALPSGVYVMKLSNKAGVCQTRVLKME